MKNVVAAKHIIDNLPRSIFKGVLFFDNETYTGQWMILERSGRCLPKNQSPISERDAFVIFDEPRCRGSDIKLRVDARALLTIGPGMCKDKLMQAAGRLRQLDRGQSLLIVGGKDVFTKIRSYCAPQNEIVSRDVLQWTMKNTVQATAN
eukprot:9458160-Ditylum_brightwellii.AAC.1